MNAHETFKKLQDLRTQTSSEGSLLRHCRGDYDRYGRLRALVLAAREAGTYDAYAELTRTIGGQYNYRTGNTDYAEGNEFRVASAFFGLYHTLVLDRPDLPILTKEELEALLTEKGELEALFETRRANTMTDAVYGRTRHSTFFKPTGEQVRTSVDRQGSLGS